MKNEKGISLMTLLITVIVLIILSSISIYNGINLVNDTRKKDAEDKLKVICSAILKDDTFLNFSGDTEVTLTEADFDYMDLLRYYDEDYEVKVIKAESINGDNRNVTYTLDMKNLNTSDEYSYTFDYNVYTEKYNYNVSFDEANGVNRPIIIAGMTALMPDGVTPVEDIYQDNWYSYKKTQTIFARMKYQDKTYVWIPRFAYDIQNFYEGRASTDVPSTAVSVIFLRGTSSYMSNDEVMQGEYRVHPAFTKDGVEYSGIWVEETVRENKITLTSSPLYDSSNSEFNLHMMTNMECGAVMYLMYALDDTNEIKFKNDEYVAACIDDLGRFSSSDGFVTLYTSNESGDINLTGIYGDAFYETPWNREIADYPTEEKKYVIRKFDSSFFDFTNSDGTDSASYRGVITIK